MKEFFPSKKAKTPTGKEHTCSSCGLYKDCVTKRMNPYGNFKKGIMNIGEAPSEFDDRSGKPWQSRTGRILQKNYEKLGIDLFEDCININATRCYSDQHEFPSKYEVDCCRRFVLSAIETYKPKLIILLGDSAIYSLIGHRWKLNFGNITKWRGWTIPDQELKTWVCPVFSPDQILENDNDVERTIWKNDLKKAFSKLDEPIPIYQEPDIEVIDDLYRLTNIRTDIAFDYETTGLKPHEKGHRIVCCSVAVSANHAYVFMIPPTRKEVQPFIDLLANPNIGKIAQNCKFEDSWSAVRLRQPVENWLWDTMLAAHILDNRVGVSGLKFQTYVQLGVIDYASEVTPYLKAVDNKNANALNKIMELVELPGGKEKLMKYCGYDAINEYRISVIQRELINENSLPF